MRERRAQTREIAAPFSSFFKRKGGEGRSFLWNLQRIMKKSEKTLFIREGVCYNEMQFEARNYSRRVLSLHFSDLHRL